MNAATQTESGTNGTAPGVLVVLRHGQSTWNELNLFTGWHDVPLSAKGEAEADAAGRTLRDAGLRFDAVYTSLLTRAMDTNRRALAQLGQPDAPVTTDWRLNYRRTTSTSNWTLATICWLNCSSRAKECSTNADASANSN